MAGSHEMTGCALVAGLLVVNIDGFPTCSLTFALDQTLQLLQWQNFEQVPDQH